MGNPTTLTLEDLRALPAHDQAVTLECAGNGRLDMRPLPTGEPWGDYAVSTARWTGALLSDVLALAQPAADGVDVRFEGADHGPYHLQAILPETNQNDLTFVRALPLAEAADPASDILLAYEMNGEPLTARSRRPVPAHRAALVRRRLGEVAEADRRPHRALHRRVPDRPLHLPVAGPPARGRDAHARARPHHRPGSRRRPAPRPLHGPRKGLVGHRARHAASTSASPAKATGTRRSWSRPKGPYQWQDWSFVWDSDDVGRHTLRARATDAAGNVQPDVPPWNRLGYGNNAIEVIFVDRG